MAVIYEIDGRDLREYGVHVSRSSGIIGRPNIKARRSVSYADEDGEYVDLKTVRYEKRDITLECFMEGNRENITERYNNFLSVLRAPGTRRVKVMTSNGSKPLVFEVYLNENTYATPDWRYANSVMTFSVKLTEAKPIKRVYRRNVTASGASLTMQITTDRIIDIHWGDQQHTLDVVGTQTLTHTYDGDTGNVLIVLSGGVDGISDISFDHSCDLIWDII